jgi:hypothetical protein
MTENESKEAKALKKHLDNGTHEVPLPFAALMLSATMILPRIFLGTFLVGIGIYVSKLC